MWLVAALAVQLIPSSPIAPIDSPSRCSPKAAAPAGSPVDAPQ